MEIIKYGSLLLIFLLSSAIGLLYSKKFIGRVNDLHEMRTALMLFKSKIRFTYKSIPDVFEEISKVVNKNIGKIYIDASKYMKEDIASVAWDKSIEKNENSTNMLKQDVEVLKSLSKMLGNMDLDGQIENINLVIDMLDKQIVEAISEQKKNSKLYKTIGAGVGLTIAIILV